MIIWITAAIGRWATPDPEEELMMVGHVIRDDDGLTLVDPPVVPGLPSYLASLGSVRAIVLTTHDHTRGSRYLSDLFSCPVFAPVQADRTRLQAGRVERPEWYEDHADLPGHLVARRAAVTLSNGRPYMDEMMLQRSDVLFIGDLLAGKPDGTLAVCPEQFPGASDVAGKTAAVARTLLREITSPPQLILAAHGWPFAGLSRAALIQRVPD